jgi:hypothetical protein
VSDHDWLGTDVRHVALTASDSKSGRDYDGVGSSTKKPNQRRINAGINLIVA